MDAGGTSSRSSRIAMRKIGMNQENYALKSGSFLN